MYQSKNQLNNTQQAKKYIFHYTTTPYKDSISLQYKDSKSNKDSGTETSDSCLVSSHNTSASEMPS